MMRFTVGIYHFPRRALNISSRNRVNHAKQQQQCRYNSSESEITKQTTSPSPSPSSTNAVISGQSPPPPPPSPPRPSTASPASAGASVPGVPGVGKNTSLSLRDRLRSSPMGKIADTYSRAQNKRPYWTQIICTLFIYLCADLSAQLLVPSLAGSQSQDDRDEVGEGVDDPGGTRDSTVAVQKTQEGKHYATTGEEGVQYDPLRTLRHLTVGAVACIPAYEWYVEKETWKLYCRYFCFILHPSIP